MGRTIRGKSDATSRTSASSDKQTPTVHLDTTCPICQEPVGVRNPEGVTERWSKLPCGHSFGSYCIKQYLGIAADEQPPCPICRMPAYHGECGHPVLPTVLDKSNRPQLSPAKTKNAILDHMLDASAVNDDGSLPQLCLYCRTHMLGGSALANLDLQEMSRWKKPLVSLWRATPFYKNKHPIQPSPVAERIERNRRRRENPHNWEGPYVDVRERDVEWERWWKNQAPRSA